MNWGIFKRHTPTSGLVIRTISAIVSQTVPGYDTSTTWPELRRGYRRASRYDNGNGRLKFWQLRVRRWLVMP